MFRASNRALCGLLIDSDTAWLVARRDGRNHLYVHEGWRDGQFTVCLHRADCIDCNDGTGQVAGSQLRRGKWHGPFKSRGKAVAKLVSVPGIAARVTCESTQ